MAEGLYLLARLAGRGIAIDAGEVETVIDLGAIVPVPRAHPAVRGVAALRSRVVTVIDTWAMLDAPAPVIERPRAVIAGIEGHGYAIQVDAVDDVATLMAEPLPRGLALGGGWGAAARGAAVHQGELLLIVALAALVPGVNSAVTDPAAQRIASPMSRPRTGTHA